MIKNKKQVKIIGGKWKNTNIKVLDENNLRPTSSRLRTTLFNWLMNDVKSSNCLDMFAGTGALGLEALSRGATKVTFIEKSPTLIKQLSLTLQSLAEVNQYQLLNADSVLWLENRNYRDGNFAQQFQIVFLDPPFASNYDYNSLIQTMYNQDIISSQTIIYTEMPANADINVMVNKLTNLVLYKHTKISQVQAGLWRKN